MAPVRITNSRTGLYWSVALARSDRGVLKGSYMAFDQGRSARNIEALTLQRREAEEIALRLFRFRARRGVGVFYTLLSALVLLALILADFIGSSYDLAVIMVAAIFVVVCNSRRRIPRLRPGGL